MTRFFRKLYLRSVIAATQYQINLLDRFHRHYQSAVELELRRNSAARNELFWMTVGKDRLRIGSQLLAGRQSS